MKPSQPCDPKPLPILALILLLCFMEWVAADPASPTVLFMVGEQEYHTKDTLAEFAEIQLKPKGIRCVFALAEISDPNYFKGLEALPEADLLVLSVRRRTPDKRQMKLIKDHLKRGKPLAAIRTSSHAFDAPPQDADHVQWTEFDREILGADYENHYGNKPPTDPPTEVWIKQGSFNHPLLQGLEPRFHSTSHLYKNRALHPDALVLIEGRVAGPNPIEPVAWIFASSKQRIFYVSLGNPDDFHSRNFAQLLSNAIMWGLEKD